MIWFIQPEYFVEHVGCTYAFAPILDYSVAERNNFEFTTHHEQISMST